MWVFHPARSGARRGDTFHKNQLSMPFGDIQKIEEMIAFHFHFGGGLAVGRFGLCRFWFCLSGTGENFPHQLFRVFRGMLF